jgi:hypothetical protein
MHNRPEVIAVKFYGCIKNACETMLISMLRNDFGYWVKRYPGIKEITGYGSIKETYYQLMKFTPKDFLIKMRKPYDDLIENEIVGDMARLLGDLADPGYSSITSLEIALHEISKYEFCEKIYVYDTALGELTKNYIAGTCSSAGNKVYMYTGFLKELMMPEVTTYFVDDVEDLMKIMEEYEYDKREDELKGKQFFVESPNAVCGENEAGLAEFKYQQYMLDAKKRFDANVTWITSHYVDINDPDPKANITTWGDFGIKKHRN